ncbi:hypothetical protein AB0I30_29820 [Nocardia tengchongensis]
MGRKQIGADNALQAREVEEVIEAVNVELVALAIPVWAAFEVHLTATIEVQLVDSGK